MHAKGKSLEEVYRVFDNSSMISAHVQHGYGLSAFEIFSNMLQARVSPNKLAYLCVLKACAQLGYLEQGRLIHNLVTSSSLEVDERIGNVLVDVYVKSGSLPDAQSVFNGLHTQDVVPWSALIGGYAQQGHEVKALELFQNSLLGGLKPNRVTFLSALKACSGIGAFIEGTLIHDQICRSGMEVDVTLASSLVYMYGKCGILHEAQSVFDNIPQGAVVPWNALICGYVLHGHIADALEMLNKMKRQGIKPSKVTFLTILKACHSLDTLIFGQVIHDEIIRSDTSSDVAIGNALVDMYGKCGSLEEAKQVFSTLTMCDLVSWSAMMDGFIRHGQQLSALEHYMRMQEEGILPDEASFSSILRACIAMGSVEQGVLIHDQIIRSKLEADLVVGSALVDMYAKSGFLHEARNVLGHIPSRNAVSWGALIAGYSYYGHSYLAIEAFQKMQHEGTQPDEATLVCTLRSCASVGDVKLGMSLHHQLILHHFDSDAQVGTALVDMYSKSARLKEARRVFDSQKKQDAVSWGALIGGYAFCKEFKMANDCVNEMQDQGLKPLGAIYTSVISGCSYAGQVTDGHQHFRSMTGDHNTKLNIEQYTCMVDLLGRTGSLGEASDVLHTMPTVPDGIAWTSLLTGCKVYGNADLCYNKSPQNKHSLQSEHLSLSMTNNDVRAMPSNPSMSGNCQVQSSSKQHLVEVCSNLHTPSNFSVPPIDAILDQTVPKNQLNPIFCMHCERVALALGLTNSNKHDNSQLGSHCSACHNFVNPISNVNIRRGAMRNAYSQFISNGTRGLFKRRLSAGVGKHLGRGHMH